MPIIPLIQESDEESGEDFTKELDDVPPVSDDGDEDELEEEKPKKAPAKKPASEKKEKAKAEPKPKAAPKKTASLFFLGFLSSKTNMSKSRRATQRWLMLKMVPQMKGVAKNAK